MAIPTTIEKVTNQIKNLIYNTEVKGSWKDAKRGIPDHDIKRGIRQILPKIEYDTGFIVFQTRPEIRVTIKKTGELVMSECTAAETVRRILKLPYPKK